MSRVTVLTALGLVACGLRGDPVPPTPRVEVPEAEAPGPDTAAGVTDPTLQALISEHWDAQMRRWPEWATSVADRRFDEQVTDPSPAALADFRRQTSGFLDRARAIEPAGLSEEDALHRELLIGYLEEQLSDAPCNFERWRISPRENPVVDLFQVLDVQVLDTPQSGARMVTRVQGAAAALDVHTQQLRSGLVEGLVANAESTRRVLAMADEELSHPIEQWSTWTLADRAPSSWSEGEAEAFRAGLREALDVRYRAALQRYRDLLAEEILPAARSEEEPGLTSLTGAEGCYAARIRSFTSLDVDAETLHQRGLDQLDAIHAEMRVLSERLFGDDDLPRLFARLREDPTLRFETREQVLEAAEDSLSRARAALPRAFGHLPRTDCVVAEIPAAEAPYTTIAYYRQLAPDGSKPGEYFVNTWEPTTRPRFEAQALAFHESIPGHHLQIAISYELPDTPAFERLGGQTAFVEGWALYSERLADELGLYTSDLDRLGMLSFASWRAARLVVDSGVHAQGWSREQAVRFMLENTPLAENNIRNEVDRYITWPGQALAYMTGQLVIQDLRREAEAALGERFDRSAFHDRVLEKGALPLPVLQRRVREWIAERGAE